MHCPLGVAHRLPFDTEHGDVFVARLHLAASPARVWEALSAVEAWPTWVPFVTWTSAQIAGSKERFTVLSGETLLAAEVHDVEIERYAHVRCAVPDRPQPPAADCCVALVPETPESTSVIVQFRIEPWLLASFQARMSTGESPPMAFLRSLQRAVEAANPPG